MPLSPDSMALTRGLVAVPVVDEPGGEREQAGVERDVDGFRCGRRQPLEPGERHARARRLRGEPAAQHAPT